MKIKFENTIVNGEFEVPYQGKCFVLLDFENEEYTIVNEQNDLIYNLEPIINKIGKVKIEL